MSYLADHLAILMFISLVTLIFLGFPVAFILAGIGMAFGFIGWILGVFNPLQFFNILPRVWGGIVTNQVLVAIPMFILMGAILERSGIAKQLLYTLQILLRRTPAGLALSVMLMGTIMAATTGIVGASVVMLTLIAMPAMLERGYDTRLASGTIAASGTLGILIPPSVMLIVIADQIQVPVGTLFSGALIPGLMLSAFYTIYILAHGLFLPHHAPKLVDDGSYPKGHELVRLLLVNLAAPGLLILLVLGSILAGWATPTEASAVGVFGALMIAWLSRSLTRESLASALGSAASTNAMVIFIIVGATVFSYLFRVLGGDEIVVDILAAMGITDAWSLLIFVMIIVFFMGFFFDWIEIILIILPIFTPIFLDMDFSVTGVEGQQTFFTWFAVLLAVMLQTSFVTPPFAISLFFLKGALPGTVTLKEAYIGAVPFVVVQILALLLLLMFPGVALWAPAALGYYN